MVIFPTTPRCKAASAVGGAAVNVHKARCTAGRLFHSQTWQGRKARGCPFCPSEQLCECNSLETVCPDIAADFDTEKNGVSPAEVTSSAATKYSWLSDEPGAKKRSVAQRTHYRKRSNRLARP